MSLLTVYLGMKEFVISFFQEFRYKSNCLFFSYSHNNYFFCHLPRDQIVCQSTYCFLSKLKQKLFLKYIYTQFSTLKYSVFLSTMWSTTVTVYKTRSDMVYTYINQIVIFDLNVNRGHLSVNVWFIRNFMGLSGYWLDIPDNLHFLLFNLKIYLTISLCDGQAKSSKDVDQIRHGLLIR